MLPGTWGAGPGLEPGSDPVPGRDAGSLRRGSGNGPRMVSPAGAAPAPGSGPRRYQHGLQRFRARTRYCAKVAICCPVSGSCQPSCPWSHRMVRLSTLLYS